MNRALQLDGALRSFFLHCAPPANFEMIVIYRATHARDAQQYRRLADEYAARRVGFCAQTDFRRDVLAPLMQFAHGARVPWGNRLALASPWLGRCDLLSPAIRPAACVLFLVDDNLFTRNFDLETAQAALLAQPTALGFSLRLGRNTQFCYPLDRPQTPPAFQPIGNGIARFDWRAGDGDFGYPLEVSSSLYRLREVLPILNRCAFHNPNVLEERLAARARAAQTRLPNLLCFETSVTFCNPANKVQTHQPNRASTRADYTSENLAQLFEAGYRLDVSAFANLTPNACHQEVELVFEKRPG